MKRIIIIFLCCSSAIVYAQKNTTSTNKQAQKSYDAAGEALSYNNLNVALNKLADAVAADPNFAIAYQQIGDINRKLQQYQKAKASYRKVLEIDPQFHSLTFFGLAESELNTGEYDSALQHFNKYISMPGIPPASLKLAKKYIIDCEFSIEALKNPVVYNPVNLGATVNSVNDEYLPVVTADEATLIYTRNISGNNEDFYTSSKTDQNWGKSTYLSSVINTTIYNEGAQCISPDGMYLFFTGCNRPDGSGKCDIYVCRREGKDWSKPFNLGAPINTPGWESQPSISADGRTLYFVSTRPGGYGGYDIWKSDLKPGDGWSAPVNLGPEINTPYDEISPFIHQDDNTLYFASNGWPGLGNKDLFFSKKNADGNWIKPTNMGYPINSSGEESCLTVSTNGRTGFFSANIKGGFGGMDIYSFEVPQALRPNIVTYVKGKVFDAKTKEPLNANIKITALKTNTIAFEDISDYETGEFLATMQAGKLFGLTADKKGYLFHSESFSLDRPDVANKPFHISVGLQKIEPGSMVVLNNIFFETNKFDLLSESKNELQYLISFLKSNPTITIEIAGHTDDDGDEKMNQVLSENRAKNVYNYLIDNKIEASRLTYKGFGETKPVESNATEEGKQRNRRTEFKVIKI